MSRESSEKVSVNSWLENELYTQYLHDRRAVDDSWQEIFDACGATNGNTQVAPAVDGASPAASAAAAKPAPTPAEAGPDEELVPLRGASARIVENMNASLAVPVATSQRSVAVKVIDENRRIINEHMAVTGGNKISYTHIIAWAMVQALKSFPAVNCAYAEVDGQPNRLVRRKINIGIAVDVAGKDGNRSLMVPSIKNAGAMNFHEFMAGFDDIVIRARNGKLTLDDFRGATISLTNPGTVGTMASVPRLMQGQGAIIATGVIDYPAGYEAVTEETRASLGLSKVMTVTCTYDHRVIQGAESGSFLGKLAGFLQGEEGFYDHLFSDLKIPYLPVRWERDRYSGAPGAARTEGRIGEFAKQAAVLQMINAYRVRGHLIADLDPLGSEPQSHPELDPATYGLTIWDMDREFLTGTLGRLGSEPLRTAVPDRVAPLRQILRTLRKTYCGKIGCEYMHISNPEEKRWLQERMEPQANSWPISPELKKHIFGRLAEAEGFEHFLQARFIGHKRFSLEGAETAMAILDELVQKAGEESVHEVVIGMAHRGRLNVLANLVGKATTQVLSEFEGNTDPTLTQGSGDVKYHLGATGLRTTRAGNDLAVSVSPNPSHLEAVDPVVEGIVRPKQDRLGDTARARVIPVLVHGDSAFAGQGVVAETLNFSQVAGYTTGGTIHVIINNQIGFTTMPEEARTAAYCTDVARTVQAPIFHVNGDDPEAAIRVAQMAFDYRQRFKKDVVIDMVCYRRHGHNEADDPSYTQPILYRKIKSQPSVATLYGRQLVREGVLTEEEAANPRQRVQQRLSEAHEEAVRKGERYQRQELSDPTEEVAPEYCPRTNITLATVEKIIHGLARFPEDFHLHPKLRRLVERRGELLSGGSADWATGEALAFGSLLLEGTPVRLSGQDSGRGTFSQRHLEFYDYDDGHLYTPMQHLEEDQGRFEVWDSTLSEYAIMGFEFGFSLGAPLTLVMWEAQFGDFANGAQILIDQFLSSSEEKWGQPSGLTLLLPHGYEGQGPEHSSARIERFLQLCAEDNMQVCNCSTPAQYFHLLRRQMYGGYDRRGVRKPLIVFTPKSLLRSTQAVSPLNDFLSGGFRHIIDDFQTQADRISKVLLTSGKIYYDLLAAREEKQANNIAIVRLEQFYPFPHDEMHDLIHRYPGSTEFVWVQEEPRNMGAWAFVSDRIQPLLDDTRRKLAYAGREESASPATGSLKRHQAEQAAFIEEAFTGVAAHRPWKVRRHVRTER